MRCVWPYLSSVALLLVVLAAPAAYANDGDQVHIGGKSINVEPDQSAGDLVCIGCSIHMQGSCGDMVAIGGSVDLSGRTTGDVVVIGGSLHLAENANVAGDVAIVGGRMWRDPNAIVHGNVSAHSGALVFVLLVLLPSLPIILIIAFVVWLFSRNQREAPVQA
jgi:hypothetical protein